jgi:hypothetical protein
VTVDEELARLEDDLRRLKVEYEVYFSGGSPRPPRDTLYRVETVIKRYTADQSNLSFGQRFKFGSLAQKFAVNNQLWKRKLSEKEEGRGQFAVPRREPEEISSGGVRVVCSDPENEPEKVARLLKAMLDAKRQAGERTDNIDPVAFQKFVSEKTKQIKNSLGCEKVQFSVTVEEGKVKFKAVKAE